MCRLRSLDLICLRTWYSVHDRCQYPRKETHHLRLSPSYICASSTSYFHLYREGVLPVRPNRAQDWFNARQGVFFQSRAGNPQSKFHLNGSTEIQDPEGRVATRCRVHAVLASNVIFRRSKLARMMLCYRTTTTLPACELGADVVRILSSRLLQMSP